MNSEQRAPAAAVVEGWSFPGHETPVLRSLVFLLPGQTLSIRLALHRGGRVLGCCAA